MRALPHAILLWPRSAVPSSKSWKDIAAAGVAVYKARPCVQGRAQAGSRGGGVKCTGQGYIKMPYTGNKVGTTSIAVEIIVDYIFGFNLGIKLGSHPMSYDNHFGKKLR
jgi:hypothetical protein